MQDARCKSEQVEKQGSGTERQYVAAALACELRLRSVNLVRGLVEVMPSGQAIGQTHRESTEAYFLWQGS